MGYCGGPPSAYGDLTKKTDSYMCDCGATTPSSGNNANIACCLTDAKEVSSSGPLKKCPANLKDAVKPSSGSGKCYCESVAKHKTVKTMGYCGGPPSAYGDLTKKTDSYMCDCGATTPSSDINANIACCLTDVKEVSSSGRLQGITVGMAGTCLTVLWTVLAPVIVF